MDKYCFSDDKDFKYINTVDDFALVEYSPTGEVCILYEYDSGYQYHVVSLDKLLDIDTDKLIEDFTNRLLSHFVDTRPYHNHWADILKEGEKT